MELFLFDGDIDADNVLPDYTACAYIQVSIFTTRIRVRSDQMVSRRMAGLPNLRVAHQTLAESNGCAVCQECAISVFLC